MRAPFGDNRRYDLVIEAGGRFLRVQRKTASLTSDRCGGKGCIRFKSPPNWPAWTPPKSWPKPSPNGTWPDPATSPPSSTPESATASARRSRSRPGRGRSRSPPSSCPVRGLLDQPASVPGYDLTASSKRPGRGS